VGMHPQKVSTSEGPHKYGADFAIIVIIGEIKNVKENLILQKIDCISILGIMEMRR